jgi:RHS repeat-associated protein
MPTDYTYTGQKNAPEIGLMFYNARWYDPAIAHFTQADTIIPGAGSPQAWDRYAYVFNNPLKYTDPSGHAICLDGGNQCYSQEQRKWFGSSETINQIIRDITDQFGWTFKDFWTRDQLSVVRQAGWDIKNYISGLGGNGEEWIREYLGKAVFNKENILPIIGLNVNDMILGHSSYVGGNNIWFLNDGINAKTITHELGHVLDNFFGSTEFPAAIFGGGAADTFLDSLGEQATGIRFLKRLSTSFIETWGLPDDPDPNQMFRVSESKKINYGNKASAEYFAQHFMYQVYGYSAVVENLSPQYFSNWISGTFD